MPFDDSIAVRPDRTLDFSNVSWEIGQYDLNAIETAVQLANSSEGTAVVLTANGEVAANSKMRKAALSRGASEMFAVQDDRLENADTYTTALALKAAVEKIGDVDLVVCGEGSGDMYAQQTGNLLGALLGWTAINAVSAVSYDNGCLRVERSLDDGVEVLEAALPLVITVTGDINRPRIPTMKDIMGAGKKPATVWPLGELTSVPEPATKIKNISAPEETGRQKVVFDSSEESIDKFVDQLRQAL